MTVGQGIHVRAGGTWHSPATIELDEGIVYNQTFNIPGDNILSPAGSGYHQIAWRNFANTPGAGLVAEADCFYRVHFLTGGQLGVDSGADLWFNQMNTVFYSGNDHWASIRFGGASADWSQEFNGANWVPLTWDQQYDLNYGVVPAGQTMTFGTWFKFAANDRYLKTHPFSFGVTVKRWRKIPGVYVRVNGAWHLKPVSVSVRSGGAWKVEV